MQDTITAGNRTYIDIDIAFAAHPLTKDVTRKTGVEAIKQSIKLLVMYNHYEKPYHPNIGSDILKSMFENISFPETQVVIRESIISTLERYEPRAEISEVVFNAFPDDNAISVNIWFIPLNSTEPISVVVHLGRVR